MTLKLKVLCVLQKIYTSDFSKLHCTYKNSFPQRQKHLLKSNNDVGFFYYLIDEPLMLLSNYELSKHKKNILEICKKKSFAFVIINSPNLYPLVENSSTEIIFDACDWYLDYHAKEFGYNDAYYSLLKNQARILEKINYYIFQSPCLQTFYQTLSKNNNFLNSCIIQNGFPSFFKNIPKVKTQNRKKTVIFVGKLGLWYDSIITVTDKLSKDWVLQIVGDGYLAPYLMNSKQVEFIGLVNSMEKIAEYIQNADVCLMPVDDCSPIATAEYLALGKPVVHKGNKISWLIDHGKNGFIVSNEVEWLDVLNHAYQMKDDNTLINHAKSSVESWDDLYLKFIETLLKWKNFLN